MSRLIVVSNRVADLEKATQSGGLATALTEALSEENGLWFGWDGTVVEDQPAAGVALSRRGPIATATTPLTQSEYQQFYLAYSNGALWPVCHYRLDLAEFNTEALASYAAVNAKFASSVAALAEPDDVIWVHDYHLFLLARELRQLGVKNRVGWFLHIPFPPPDILTAMPGHADLVASLFDYDLIGLQTARDVANFVAYVENELGGARTGDGALSLGDRRLVVRSFPIGIDAEQFRAMATTPEADERIASLKRIIQRSYVIGVDRLDYSKGLPDRFRAFRRFLELSPEYRRKAVLMQIAPPTREEIAAYAEIRTELELLSGQINGQLGEFDWMPVRYIHRAVPREVLAALFRAAKVGLVTPLRDGMNLVAKEYVAAQDPDNPGVLILSQFAGAAEDLEEALLVNPYDVDEMARALRDAIGMPVDERRSRHEALLERVRRNDVSNWRKTFLKALNSVPRDDAGAADAPEA